ncbi:MAG: MFS transporter [Fusobacteriaceae bacterium]
MEIKLNNIKYYYLFNGIKSLLFYIPILVIYLTGVLNNSYQVGIVLTVKSFSVFLLEIPLGYIADKFGRKKSVILSIIANIISLFFLIIFPNFYTIIVSELFFSISETLCSGADIALFYDNLKYEDKEKKYGEFERNSTLISSIMLSISFVVGSWVYSYSPKAVFILSIFFSSMLLLVLRKIIEQPYKKNINENNKFKLIQLKQDLIELNKETFVLKNLIVYGAIIISVFMGIYFYIFPLELDRIVEKKILYGVIYSCGVLAIGFGSKIQKYISNNYKFIYFGGFILVPFMLILSYYKNNIFFIVFIICMRFLWGTYSTNLNIMINKELSNSSLRATIFSIKNAILNIFLGIFFLMMGYLKTLISDNFIYLRYYAFFIIVICFFYYIFLKKSKSTQ